MYNAEFKEAGEACNSLVNHILLNVYSDNEDEQIIRVEKLMDTRREICAPFITLGKNRTDGVVITASLNSANVLTVDFVKAGDWRMKWTANFLLADYETDDGQHGCEMMGHENCRAAGQMESYSAYARALAWFTEQDAAVPTYGVDRVHAREDQRSASMER